MPYPKIKVFLLILLLTCVNCWAGEIDDVLMAKEIEQGIDEILNEPHLKLKWVDKDDINNALINAIICVESNWNANAYNSETGCRGLAQISEIVLREFNDWNYKNYLTCYENGFLAMAPPNDWQKLSYRKQDLFNSEINIQIARWYLRRLKEHYLKDHYSLENLLSAYNGGITRLRKVNYDWTKMPKETRDYVKKVMKIYKQEEIR